MVGTTAPEWRLNRWERRGTLAENLQPPAPGQAIETPWQPVDLLDVIGVTCEGTFTGTVTFYVSDADQPGLGTDFASPTAPMTAPGRAVFDGVTRQIKAVVSGFTAGTVRRIGWCARDRVAL